MAFLIEHCFYAGVLHELAHLYMQVHYPRVKWHHGKVWLAIYIAMLEKHAKIEKQIILDSLTKMRIQWKPEYEISLV
jgi:predicted SprT family Zn-dependent metalloprotease